MRHDQSWAAVQAVALLLLATQVRCIRYETGARRSPGKLNVHIVSHSHDDSGWLKTVDQYYWGANQTIQMAGVQYVLDTVVQALVANPNRKFVYAEMSFFTRWWDQQDDEVRETVAALVEEGRLDFVNGGYVQHDEATAHYVGMIDQTTLGHRFLKRTFGKVPRVGWQVDPFGHSATQAGLLGAAVGFDALFFGRADYQDMDVRKARRQLEVVWRGSGSMQDAELFTGNFASGSYTPPPGFDFDWSGWGSEPMMDDPRLDGYNVQQRVDDFVFQCLSIANVTRGEDIMLTMGTDFEYSNAHVWYKNLDKLMHYANADGRINAFYSTPAEYVAAKHGYGQAWPLKTDDFFPYADAPHAFWTGYFSSRPTSKRYIREASSYLQAARQMEAFVGVNASGATTSALGEAVALCQHHDSITGTAKQHVANDYHRRIHTALREGQAVVMNALQRLIGGEYIPPSSSSSSSSGGGGGSSSGVGQEEEAWGGLADSRRRALRAEEASSSGGKSKRGPNPVDAPVQLGACDWLNVTACGPSVRMSREGRGMMVAAYNPLGWSRTGLLRVPVDTSETCMWTVTGPEEQAVASEIVPRASSTEGLQNMLVSINATCPASLGDAELVFSAELPPLGYSTYFVRPAAGRQAAGCSSSNNTLPSSAPGGGSRTLTLDNGLVSLDFDTKTGLLMSAKTGGVGAALSTAFRWYNSSDGLEVPQGGDNNRGQASGAYIFRPNGRYDVQSPGEPVALEVVQGDLVSEARQIFSPWATLITRLHKGQAFVEFEWTVGPIPVEDGLGKEVVLQFSSDLESGASFWTDANGREMLERTRDTRPTWKLNVTEPVSGNYYPLTAVMAIRDETRELSVLTDRAQGGGSMRGGEMEVMVHRRTLADDARGVGEPLNETACGCLDCNCTGLVARGVHRVLLAPLEDAARQRRRLQQELNDPPVLGFGPIPTRPEDVAVGGSNGGGIVGLRRTFSLSEGHILHSNLHLLTLMDTGDNSFLVRLAHLFETDEDPELGKPITTNLNSLLQLLQYEAVHELTLSANQQTSKARRLQFKAGDRLGGGAGSDEAGRRSVLEGQAEAEVIDCRVGCKNEELLVTLQPMEIRTFELKYGP